MGDISQKQKLAAGSSLVGNTILGAQAMTTITESLQGTTNQGEIAIFDSNSLTRGMNLETPQDGDMIGQVQNTLGNLEQFSKADTLNGGVNSLFPI